LNRNLLRTGAIVIAALPLISLADPVLNPANNHYYEVIAAPAISWEDANLAAQGLSYNGIAGHLATLTSPEENAFVDGLRESLFPSSVEAPAEVWVGGFQAPGSIEPGGGWQWVNGEGPFPGTDCLPVDGCVGPYADWADQEGEPNDANGSEQGLALGRYGPGAGWNDEGAAIGYIVGYVVEFDNTADALNCLEGVDGEDETNGGCNPSGGFALVQLDNGSDLKEGDRITQGFILPPPAFACPWSDQFYKEIRVDPTTGAVVDRRPLDVFGEMGGGTPGALILDAQTYGNFCFGVLKSEATFTILETLENGGVATVTQYPDALVPDELELSCNNPDLQWRAQATYQPDNRYRMAEEAAAAMTKRCNSPSRKSTPEFSFYLLNTREDCGIDFSAPGGPAAVFECMNNYATVKFDAIDQLLLDAAPFLGSPKLSVLTKEVNRARSMVKTQKWDRATTYLESLLDKVETADWNLDPTGINYPGYLIMRIDNLLFRVSQLEDVSANL
jgi:hypothetical protein